MGNSLSSKRQKNMKKIGPFSDILIDIIRRLSLKEQFVCISVTQQFHLAALQALKQHNVLVVTQVNYERASVNFFLESNVKNCWCRRHKLKKKDAIDSLFFNNPKTRGKILAYLPGIKVVNIDRYVKGFCKDLSEYCPNIECLVIEYSDELASQPEVTHFTGYVDAVLISKLPQVFPKLTTLSLRLVRPSNGDFNEQCFREGITRLKLSSMRDNWPTIFKSPAMKTVKELDMHTSSIDRFGDRYFVAPNLISIRFINTGYNDPKLLTFILKSLCSSPFLQNLILQTRYMTDPQEVSVSLFTSFNCLKVIKLPRLVDINKILQTICRNNPLLEDVLVHDINEENGYVGLQEFSHLMNLKSLEIVNNHSKDKGITKEQLLEFLAENQVEGQLRFFFILHQWKDFPRSRDKLMGEMDWNAIKWKYYPYYPADVIEPCM